MFTIKLPLVVKWKKKIIGQYVQKVWHIYFNTGHLRKGMEVLSENVGFTFDFLYSYIIYIF